jgi:phosphoribosylformimino-5-aminoimidazole carboxamide ribotide isomerase
MRLYPAIDIQKGQVVRLAQGILDQATHYGQDPLAQAHAWADQGAEWIHVVDLDAAAQGKPINVPAIESILQGVNIPVQIGGGIRNRETAEIYLTLGAGRVVIGSAALKDPKMVALLCEEFPERVAVGLDARDGKVAIHGWQETSDQDVLEVAKQFEGVGVAAIIYTDIARDGMLTGPNIGALKKMAETISIPIIASGGISNLEDIKQVKACESLGIEGVIVGRALYEKKFLLSEAIEAIK